MSRHRDETGAPCKRHGEVTEQRLYELATLGSRMLSFHHDAASKLQSLIMALDDISELAAEGDLRAPVDTAHTALRDLNQILSANRALAKAPQGARIGIGELVHRAADSVGVRTRGELPSLDVRVAIPALRHALSLLHDLAAGPSHLGRVVDVSCTSDGDGLELTITGPVEAVTKLPPSAPESTAIANFIIDREDGELRCSPSGFLVRVPLAPPPTGAIPAVKL